MSAEVTIYQQPSQALNLVEIRQRSELYPRLCNYKPESAVNTLAGIVAMAFTYVGKEFAEEDLRVVASGLYADLMRNDDRAGTHAVTPDEIAYAVRKAILSNEPMYGINVASLYKAVRSYCLGEGHEAQLIADRRAKEERQKQLQASPLGAIQQAYTGQMTKNLKSSHK